MPKPSEWVPGAVELIQRFSRRWAVAGALAADEYRVAKRLTTDVDLYADWHEGIPEVFEEAGFEVRRIVDPQVGHPHLLMCKRDIERIDVMFPTVAYQELALERAQARHVLTPEDVIIHKLIAWRPRDQDDVLSILAAGHDLDREYIEEWAREWEVLDRWREATGPR